MASTSTLQKTNKGKKKGTTAKRMYDPELAHLLDENKVSGADGTDQRLLRLHYGFERYLEELPEGHVIRYEDIVESRGKALSVIVPAAAELDEPLENKNLNPLYDKEKVLEFGERLLKSEGAYWRLYSRADIEMIMDAVVAST